ncbi:ferric iron ABC transporter, permease protein [Rhodobacteraceae bacterium HTCC2083]|nr:ferric iron ABC transporter, permease protein [Rhodobacteraceae bacterium HTCC2083]
MPVVFEVIVPTITLIAMGLPSEQNIFSSRYLHFIQNSLTLASIAALVTVAADILIGTFNRVASNKLSLASLFIGRLGYALPGGVIAVGLLVPFAGFNNWLEARIDALFGISTGLLISGSIWLLIAAYMIRF